jgi:Zn-dependent protease with chaperone function
MHHPTPSQSNAVTTCHPASPHIARWRRIGLLAIVLVPLTSFFSTAWAKPTQEEVFKSIQSSVSGEDSAGHGFALMLLCAGAAVLGLLYYISRRAERVAPNRSVNHTGKLIREVRKQVGLNSAELKQLKLLSEQLATEDQPAPNPLTLLICPSVLARAVKLQSPKIDRQVLAGLVKRMKMMD